MFSMSMTFEEWKEANYGKDYQHGYDEINGFEVCDGTCDACLWDDYVRHLEDENDGSIVTKKGVEINGVVYSVEGSIEPNEFIDSFIEFVESKGWYFGGGIAKQIDEKGKIIE